MQLYVLSDRKVQCDARMPLLFSGEWNGANRLSSARGLDWEFMPWELSLNYLCKFKATLTPEQMREDLLFEDAPDDEPYRERIVRW